MDTVLFIIKRNGKDTQGDYTQWVAVHHDGDCAGNDPDDSFFAVSIMSPLGGNIPQMDFADYATTIKNINTSLFDKISRAFNKAKKTRDNKKARDLTGIKKITANVLRAMLNKIEM